MSTIRTHTKTSSFGVSKREGHNSEEYLKIAQQRIQQSENQLF